MKSISSLKYRVRITAAFARFIAALSFISPLGLGAADVPVAQSPPAPKKVEKKTQKKSEPRIEKKLNGAELYAIHCNRCHPERYAPERTGVQWKTILLHMRIRANVPAKEANAILKFLQEDSGT